MTIVTFSQWTDFLSAHPDAHILQDARWGELKADFGWDPIRIISGSAGAQLLIRHLPLGVKMAYIPKGPVGAISESLLDEIDHYCTQNGIAFLKVEMDEGTHIGTLADHKMFSPGFQTIQPRRSIVIDIKGDVESILAHMKQKTRYNIGLSSKKGVHIQAWNDIQSFHTMMQTTGERDAFGVHSLEYYRKSYDLFHESGDCELLVAQHEGDFLAALMVFKAGKRAWYFYGASSNLKRSLMPTYLLQWQAILWAKNHGCESYDLWGVPDSEEMYLEQNFESRHDGLWGVYRFKRGFGGNLIRSPESLDRVYIKNHYHLYRIGLQLLRKTDRG